MSDLVERLRIGNRGMGARDPAKYIAGITVAEANQAAARIEALEKALREIRDQDWVEAALDPQWGARIARSALQGKGG